jgi:chloride channel protein, CIC family
MQEKGDFSAGVRLLWIAALAVGIGAICAGVAVVLLWLIGFFTNLFYFQHFSLHVDLARLPAPADNTLGWLAVGVPVLGGLIIGLIARYGSERIRGHGIPEAMEAILIGQSRMTPRVAVLKPLSSAISIGSGGPFGAEGPIIMTGGAIGSIIAQVFHMTAAERKTLLVAGAAGGMAATFATPVAAVLLAVELLLFEWKPRSLIPVALSAAVAASIRPFLPGPGPLFHVPLHDRLPASALLAAVLVGLVAGLLALLLTVAVYGAEDAFHRLPIHWVWWPALGGLAVGIGGLFQPRPGGGLRHHRPAPFGQLCPIAAGGFTGGQGHHLGGGARLGNFGRRAGTVAHHGRRARRPGFDLPTGRRPGALAVGKHGGRPGRDHALSPDRRYLRPRTDE